MIFLGLLPGNTYSAILKRGALMASFCVLCAILTPNNMVYHKWLYRSRRLVAEVEAAMGNLPVPLCPWGKSSDGLSGGRLAGRLIPLDTLRFCSFDCPEDGYALHCFYMYFTIHLFKPLFQAGCSLIRWSAVSFRSVYVLDYPVGAPVLLHYGETSA